ncbi:MAG: Triacylglycerol lipase [Acidimicrobiales bacterium]|nr:Triacylglycerol lipase [Acidimicrobiales bacterium]
MSPSLRRTTGFRRRAAAAAASLAVTAATLVALPAGTAGASGPAFYDAPATMPAGAHGTLVRSATAAVNIAGAPGVNAWTIMYKSQDSNGADNIVTGTLLVPKARWDSGFFGLNGPRPLLAYAPGSHGLANHCAPSRQFAAGTDYENANIAAALAKNWAVVVTDYEGYTNGATPTYLAGRSQGQAVLDSILAARQVSGTGLSASARSAVWGYSQGGQSAAWAGEIASSYAPGINLTGVAAGGVPGDFKASARNLNGSTGAAFLLGGVVGLAEEYPAEIPFDLIANDAGKAAVADAKQKCVFESLFDYRNRDIGDYTLGGLTLEQLLGIPSVSATLDAQNLGANRIDVPLYQYHGQSDEFLPLDQAIDLKKSYCANGSNVKFDLYQGEHIATQFQAASYATNWLSDRLSGKPQFWNDCGQNGPEPVSTALPGGGDFVVPLDGWKLDGSLYIKGGIRSTVDLPSSSTFTAQANVTAQTLDGSLSVPTFTRLIRILGFPIEAKITLTDTSATGTASVDRNGQLQISGNAKAHITIASAGEFGIHIPIGCRTSKPVDFGLDFTGPVSALGNGTMRFTGSTTFPSLTGCGLWGPALGLIFSGPGNTFDFTVLPQAPTAY